VLKNMVVAVTMINTDWANEKPQLARAFFLALARGTRDYCQAYHGGAVRAEVIDILMRTGIEKRPDILALPGRRVARAASSTRRDRRHPRLVSRKRFSSRRGRARQACRQYVRAVRQR